MSHIPKFAMLFLAFGVLISCEPWYPCVEGDYNYNGTSKIQFGNYYSEKYGYSKDSSQYRSTQFSFYEDSSFSYLRIMHQKNDDLQDTLIMLNGKFEVYRDSAFPWNVLRLNADSIYEKKTKDTLDGILHFTDFAISKFEGFSDSLLSDAARKECIHLNAKYSTLAEGGWAEPCGYKKYGKYWHLQHREYLCINKPEEGSEQDSTED